MLGLIIGKLTGNYPAAIISSIAIDLDHVVSYFRHGILSKPRPLLQALVTQHDPGHDQRNILHSLITWSAVSLFITIINPELGIIISLGYLGHLFLDALDQAEFYPFYPYKKVVIRGPVPYFSPAELVFNLLLLVVFVIL